MYNLGSGDVPSGTSGTVSIFTVLVRNGLHFLNLNLFLTSLIYDKRLAG